MSQSFKEGRETFAGEIRNSLTVIKTHTQLLQQYGTFPKTEKHFEKILQAVDGIDKICSYPELDRKPKIKAKDLQPGDLFSTAHPLYWEHIDNRPSVGEKVYIRTNTLAPEDQKEDIVYKIRIIK